MKCEECGRELVDGMCEHCEDDRRQGEEFVREHGMPDGLYENGYPQHIREYISGLWFGTSGWYD